MEFEDVIDTGTKLVELAPKLAAMRKGASTSPRRVESEALLYLEAARLAIHALGKERQGILSDASKCDIRDRDKVEALSERMITYLKEDNVRPELHEAITGLDRCLGRLKSQAEGLSWRRNDKLAAVGDFENTLHDLKQQLQSLEHAFFPEYSGQGLETLVKVHESVTDVRDNLRRSIKVDVRADEQKLGRLIRSALRDPAQVEWIHKAADVEGLILDLQLAFSVMLD